MALTSALARVPARYRKPALAAVAIPLVALFLLAVAVAGSVDRRLLLVGPAALFGLLILVRPKLSLFLFPVIWPLYPPLLRWFSLENSTIVKLWPEALMLLGTAGLVLGWLLHTPRLRVRVRWPDLAVGAVLFSALYAATLTASADALIYGFRLTYIPLLLYAFVRVLPLSTTDVSRWLNLLVGAMVLLAVVGILMHATDPGRWYRMLVPPELISGLVRKGEWRMSSLLLNPLYFGPIMSIAALLVFARFLAYRSWYTLVLFGLFAACAYLSLTRGALIMLGIGMVVMLAYWSLRDRSILVVSLVAGIIVVGVLLVLLVHNTGFTFFRDSSGSVLGSRYYELIGAAQAFLKAPQGYGLGVGQAQNRFAVDNSIPLVFDGWYSKVVVESGLIGIITFGSFLIAFTVFLTRRVVRSQSRFALTLHLAVLGIFVGGGVQAAVTNLWELYMVSSVLWALLALSVSLNRDGSVTPAIIATPPVRQTG